MDKKEKTRMRKDCNEMLQSMNCLVEFVKADGTDRKMLCTLQKGVVPSLSDGTGSPFASKKFRNENEDVLVVWDLEASNGEGGWRSFRLDRIKSFRPALDD